MSENLSNARNTADSYSFVATTTESHKNEFSVQASTSGCKIPHYHVISNTGQKQVNPRPNV